MPNRISQTARWLARRLSLLLFGWAPENLGGTPQRRGLLSERALIAIVVTVLVLVILAIVSKVMTGRVIVIWGT